MTDHEKDDFRRMVCYFWLERGDPERFVSWSEAKCEEAFPEFLFVWKQHKASRLALNAICNR